MIDAVVAVEQFCYRQYKRWMFPSLMTSLMEKSCFEGLSWRFPPSPSCCFKTSCDEWEFDFESQDSERPLARLTDTCWIIQPSDSNKDHSFKNEIIQLLNTFLFYYTRKWLAHLFDKEKVAGLIPAGHTNPLWGCLRKWMWCGASCCGVKRDQLKVA